MARPKGSTVEKKTLSRPLAMRFPEPMLERMQRAAEEEGWTLNVLVREAMKEYLIRRDNR